MVERDYVALTNRSSYCLLFLYPQEFANGGTQFSAITTILSAKYQLTIIFLANS